MGLANDVQADQHRFLTFARAVSGGDAAVMARAEGLIAVPPTSVEDIGFYGMKEASAEERSLRGIVTALLNAGHLLSMEDKYINELVLVLEDEGVLPPLHSDARLTLLESVQGEDDAAYVARIRAGFAGHVAAIAEGAKAQGFALLQINFGPVGDGMIFWLATPEEAEEWRGQVLSSGLNTARMGPNKPPLSVIAVTAPEWRDYWAYLTYAMMLPKEAWPYPIAE